MAVDLDADQEHALLSACEAQHDLLVIQEELAVEVKHALAFGVPLNTLATALGVSRSRVRRLARVEKSE